MPDDKISELPLVPSGTPLKATDEAVVNFRNPDDSFTTMRDTFAKMKAFFSGDKENVGIAASLLSSHVAQSNPHSQYALFDDLEYLEKLHNYVTYVGSVATIGGNFDSPHKVTFALTADCVFQGEGRKVNGVMNGSLAAKAGQFVTVAMAADDTTNSYVWAVDKLPSTNFIDSVGDITPQNNPIVDNDNINTFASKTQGQIDSLAYTKADRPNGVTTGGEIETGVDYITVSATSWMIGFVNYSAPIITFSNITLSTSGNQRYIAIYGDTSNTK